MTFPTSDAQTLDQLADQLFLGMLSFTPDASIEHFLHKYVPIVFKKFDPSVKWTMYPIDPINEPEFQIIANTYVFTKHPYFHGHFKSGRLEFTQKFYKDDKWNDNLKDIKLWFEFDDKTTARDTFKKLVDRFSSFQVSNRITIDDETGKAEFTDKDSNKLGSQIQIFLAKDNFIGKRYVMPLGDKNSIFREAGYKIVIEVGNDLN